MKLETTHGARGALGTSLVAATLTLAACGGGSSSSSSNTGTVSLSIVDAPVDDADSVVVAFNGVAVKPAGGSEIEINFATTKMIDLLALQGDVSESLLDNQALDPGQYNWIRLSVVEEASYIEIGDARHTLSIPSGSQSGLKLNRPFTIEAGNDQGFTIDFDLRRSVHKRGSDTGYRLRPTLRIVDDNDRGHIRGTVAAALLEGNVDCLNSLAAIEASIYVYENAGATPTDINIDGSGGPLTTANVIKDDATYRFTVGFLESGTYTLALTCQADLDDGEQTDTLVFLASDNVTVTVGTTTQHDITAP